MPVAGQYLARMAIDPHSLTSAALEFLAERHLASLTTTRPDGSPHVVPVGFTWDNEVGLARVITRGSSQKAHNAARGGPGVLCQVDGRRWLTLEGRLAVLEEPEAIRDAEQRYAVRYRTPRPNPERVVLTLRVNRVLGSASLLAAETDIRR